MKFFNFSVCKTSFKMETLKFIIVAMCSHLWLANVDLKDAYFHVGVVPVDRQYLRFNWLGQSYQFEALPFGLSVLSSVGLHHDPGPTDSVAQALGSTAVPHTLTTPSSRGIRLTRWSSRSRRLFKCSLEQGS